MPVGGCLGDELRGRRCAERSPDPFNGRVFADAISGSLQRSATITVFCPRPNAWRAIAFAEGVKDGSGGRVLCGGYYSDSTTGYPLAHDAMSLLLETKVIDFFSNCPGGRGDGMAPSSWNMVESIQLHGKLLIQELDLRSPRKPKLGAATWASIMSVCRSGRPDFQIHRHVCGARAGIPFVRYGRRVV